MAADLSMLLPRPLRASKATTRLSVVTRGRTVVQANDGVTKPPPRRRLQRLPPIGGGGGAKEDSRSKADAAARAAKAWMRQALAKRVATRMLKRSTAAAPSSADEGSGGGRRVLACCCARLPRGLRCALHQAGAPGRGWILRAQQQQRPARGCGDGERDAVAVVVAPPRAHGWAFSEYARWRRHVWMPSRFYLEHVEERAIDLRRSAEILFLS